MIYLMAVIFVGWIIGVISIVMEWRKDCKEYGKEWLAVSLWERLLTFAICFVIPFIVGLLVGMLQMK